MAHRPFPGVGRDRAESYTAYKERRREANYKLKEYLKGRIVWYSDVQGTYRRGTQ